MGHQYMAECKGCHRRSPACLPAAGTPPSEVWGNLFCPACFKEGKAVYHPVWLPTLAEGQAGPPRPGGWLLVGCVILGAMAFVGLIYFLVKICSP